MSDRSFNVIKGWNLGSFIKFRRIHLCKAGGVSNILPALVRIIDTRKNRILKQRFKRD